MNRQQFTNSLVTGLIYLAAGASFAILFFIISVIVLKGAGAISFYFLLSKSKNFGASGGIFYQIIGSLLLTGGCALISFPLAIGTAVTLSESIDNKFLKAFLNSLIYGANAVPSVIFGIFGLIFFVNLLHTGISWFVGSVILAMMILPTVTQAAYQAILSIPVIYRESACALGLTKWKIIFKVILPQAISGSITGLFLGLARAVGETAPVMFIATAFSGVTLPGSLFSPVVALPTHILALAQQATDKQAIQNAWGASLVLLSLVLLFSITALIFRVRQRGNG